MTKLPSYRQTTVEHFIVRTQEEADRMHKTVDEKVKTKFECTVTFKSVPFGEGICFEVEYAETIQ